MTLDGFGEMSFTHDGYTRPIYRRGEGPGVLVMHEVPGITPEVARFARRVADEGFTVWMPHLFGTPGKALDPLYAASQLAQACVRREFRVLAARDKSPITDWLRALCRALHVDVGGKGVGAIGMCLTGNFALTLMVDPWVMAPVLAQPSLPFPIGRERRAGIHVSDEDLVRIKERARKGVKVLGMRFTHDPVCPKERFETLRRELGNAFEGIEIDSGPRNRHRIQRVAHSVVTTHLVDETGHPTQEALHRVLAFFREQLVEGASNGASAH